MLSDQELDQANVQLADFRTINNSHHTTLTEILEKYSTLVQDYKRLRSDLEEERDSRERYKQLARGQERNPFVLVLIDGDGYVFDDDLISNGADGGQRAAQLLNDVVKNSLRGRGLDHCRVMVRVYANLVGLSKAVSRVKLAGPEKRSLAPFTASFTRSHDLFDFVDAGELKENADFKLRALFRQFVDNVQCRHIYFAGCHDVGYVSELTPYIGNRDRITLVRGAFFHQEFNKLNLRVEDFPNIFRSLPLDGSATTTPFKATPIASVLPTTAPSTNSGTPICTFYQKGSCRNGAKCKFQHVKVATNGDASSTRGGLSDTKNWRSASSTDKTSPFGMASLAKNDHDFMSGHVDPIQAQIDFATMLPQAENIRPGEIPVNKDRHRLDAYVPNPPAEYKAAFQARVAIQKLCYNFHINGVCPSGDSCPYDHRPASPAILNCLKQVVVNNPCPRRGTCRSSTCLYGHICQKAECKYRGGHIFCKHPPQVHHQDLTLSGFEPATARKLEEDLEGLESVSGEGSSTPPMPRARSPAATSDDEEGGNGALLSPRDDASVD